MGSSHPKMVIKPDGSQPVPKPDGSHPAPAKLKCTLEDAILIHLHHPGSRPPPVQPCDMPNASENKTAYSPEELHCLTGCCHFCNYHHIILMSKDGTLLNSGEFPLSLGSYATISKTPCGKLIDQLPSKYLNIVHINIAIWGLGFYRGIQICPYFCEPRHML